MAKAKSPRTTKPATTPATKNLLQMPDGGNGNGNPAQHSPAEVETEIRLRAFELYQERGGEPGLDEQDWFTAEREVLARRSQQKHTA